MGACLIIVLPHFGCGQKGPLTLPQAPVYNGPTDSADISTETDSEADPAPASK